MSTYLEQRRQIAMGLKAKEEPNKGKKPIPKVSEKKKAQAAGEKKLSALDKEFYLEVWHASPHVCFECACKLPKEPLTLFFHHLLEKRNYPEYRHLPENIAILCPDCHTQAETDLDKTPKVRARREEVYKQLIG